MTAQPPVTDETPAAAETAPATPAKRERAPRPPREPIGKVLRELRWSLLLILGIGTGLLWVSLLVQQQALQILAGLIPVTAGIIVGRRVREHITAHAIMLGVIMSVAALIAVGALWALSGPSEALVTAGLFAVVTLIPFPAFGVITSSRSEQRQRAVREEQQRRGGRLDRPGRVRVIEDLHGLSLPQLGGYVADLFRKHGFLVNDYRFEKDRIDFQMTYEDETWLLRVTTAEKVKPGMAQELTQRMKNEGVKKGVVITSMDFEQGAARWAKDKPVVLIDGPTLLSMND